MASFLYTSLVDDDSRGNVIYSTDTFKTMLVTSSYTPSQTTHTKRSDVTNEASGTGYTAGGATTTVTLTKDTTNNKETLTFSAVSWATSTITARGAVIYKSRGGASSADELVGYIDFGGNISSTGGTFSITQSTITKQL